MEDIDKMAREDFEKAFEHYWYVKKKWTSRLTDSIEEEERICLDFFDVLNEIGMLDKVYPIYTNDVNWKDAEE